MFRSAALAVAVMATSAYCGSVAPVLNAHCKEDNSCNSCVSLQSSSCAHSRADNVKELALKELHFARAQTQSPGMTAAVISQGALVFSGAVGLSDIENQTSCSEHTRFRIASISKPIAACCIGKLFEEGQIALDVPIQRYISQYPHQGVTVRRLMSMLAGIRHYEGQEFYSRELYSTPFEAAQLFMTQPLKHEPGAKFLYSSYSYALLSVIVEEVTKQSYVDVVDALVFRPLAMDNTCFDRHAALLSNRSRHYQMLNGRLVNAPYVDNSNKDASGGVLSTAADVAKFGYAMLSYALLSKATTEMLWTAQHTDTNTAVAYGLGWQIALPSTEKRTVGASGAVNADSDKAMQTLLALYEQRDAKDKAAGKEVSTVPPVVFHGGGACGGSSVLLVLPRDGIAVAVMCNLQDVKLYDVAVRLARLYMKD